MHVGIYCRISRDATGDALGVSRQEAKCRELAIARGWDVSAVFVDNDISAWTGKTRPGFEDLVQALRSGAINGVIVWHIDRLVRSMRDLEDVIDLDRPIWTCIAGEVDLSTDAGRAIARTLTAWGRYESDVKSRRLRAKHEQLAQSGAWASGRCFGYTVDGEVVESEAVLIRAIAERLLRGDSLRSVTSWLVREEVPTVKGGSWRGSTVRQMITAARLSGQREWTPRASGRGHGMGEIVGVGDWQAILERDETARLRALFTRPRDIGRPATRLLSGGLSVCARCGRSLQSAKDERQGRRYACIAGPGTGRCGGISVIAGPLEELVIDAALIALEGSNLESATTTSDEGILQRIVAIKADLNDLAEDHGAGAITRSEWITARRGLVSRLEVAETGLAEATKASTRKHFGNAGDVTRESWPHLDVDSKRRILSALLDGVLVGPARTRGRPRFDDNRVRLVWRA